MKAAGRTRTPRPAFRHAALALAVAALLPAAAPLPAQEIQFPLIQALAWIPPQESIVLPAGGRSWEFTLSDANIFSFSQGLTAVNDLSVFAAVFSHRRALSGGLTLELSGGFRYFYYAGVGQFIKKFDAALGFADSGRGIFSDRTIHYAYLDRFSHVRNRLAPAPLVIGLAARIHRFGSVDLNGRLGLGLPMDDVPGFVSKKAYLVAGLMGEYSRDRVSISAALQAAFFARPAWLAADDTRRVYTQAEVKATLSRWVLGVILRQSPLTFAENGNAGRMIYLAFRFKKGIEIGLMEDLPPMDTVPDVAMYVKIDLHRGHK